MSPIALLLLWCIAFSVLGALCGCLTGLVPGLHPNTVAAIVSGLTISAGAGGGLLAWHAPDVDAPPSILLACFLLGVLMAHSFMEVIPTAMLGVAGDDMVAALLPSQRLFMIGRPDLLVGAVIFGGLMSMAIFALLLFPLRMVMGAPLELYSAMRPAMGLIVLAVCASVLLSQRDRRRILLSCCEFLVSGLFGLFVLKYQVPYMLTKSLFSPLWGADPSAFLLPAFAGFFALPALMFSRQEVEHPGSSGSSDDVPIPGGQRARSVMASLLPSVMVGWIPGVTNAYAVAFGRAFKRRSTRDPLRSDIGYITTYSATNIGGAMQAILAFCTISRTRNGTLEAIDAMVDHRQVAWLDVLDPPMASLALLLGSAAAAVVGALFCACLGLRVLRSRGGARLRFLRPLISTTLVCVVFWSCGPIGLLVLLTSFLIGSWALLIGAPRIHLMGFLLLPVLMFFLLGA